MNTHTTNSKAVNLELTAKILANRNKNTFVSRSATNKTTDKKTIYTAILFLIPILVAILTSI
jgi:hypothetical protein